MLIRIIDFVAGRGGGVRFTGEVVKALASLRPEVHIEIASFGEGVDAYRKYLEGRSDRIRLFEMKPGQWWRNTHDRLFGIPGSRSVMSMLGITHRWEYDVPKQLGYGCDVVWLPWGNRHRLPDTWDACTVVTLHDVIPLEFEKDSTPEWRSAERLTLERLLRSDARVVTVSRATLGALTRMFDVAAERIDLIQHADTHALPNASLPSRWDWAKRPFVLCPANLAPHKNHEVLFRGFAASNIGLPLVLVGGGTDFPYPARGRAAELLEIAAGLKLAIGSSLIPVGFLPDALYYSVLLRSWCVVIPSLAEGAGLPLVEAIVRGIPVISADIPALREQAERLSAKALWFNPRDSLELVARLRELDRDYPAYKRIAVDQVAGLRRRSWKEVAGEYWQRFESAANSDRAKTPSRNRRQEPNASGV